MKVAVTGAGGFLGQALIRRLLESGHEPLALVRNEDDVAQFRALGVNASCRDLSRADDCREIFGGCDAVVHCAALTRDFGRWEQFNRFNIITTQNIVKEVCQAEIGKFVHVSTTAVYGNERNHYGTGEDADYGQRVVDPYTRSKIMADRNVISFMTDAKRPVTVLRFGNIWGPGDPNVLPFVVDGLKRKTLMIEGNGGNVLSLTYIDNAVNAIILALGKSGDGSRIFNITDGAKVTSRKFISDIISILGIQYKFRKIPYPLLYSMAYCLEQYYLFVRLQSKPPLTRFGARILKYNAIFDISKAMNELGYNPTISYKQAMARSTPYIRNLYYGGK